MGGLPAGLDAEPDLILVADSIITLSAGLPRAEAVAARDGLVVDVGSRREMLRLVGPRTEVVEPPGGCVVPGFHDAHIHLAACAARRLGVECGPLAVDSIGKIQQVIRERAESTPEGAWIRAGDYDEFRLAERRHPTRWDLDVAAPRHPVKLRHRSLHACVLNSAALRLAGIGRDAPSPPGTLVDLDPITREPTGLLYDYSETLSSGLVPPPEEEDLRLTLRRVLEELLAGGITSVQDATFRNGLPEWNRFRELCWGSGRRGDACVARARGNLPRIGFMVGWPYLEQFTEEGMGPGYGDEGLRIGAAKIMLTEVGGTFHPSPEDLEEQVRQANRLGYQVAIHAVEESAICVAAEALATAPRATSRFHRIEHCSLLPPPLLDRLAELGIGVATQPGFLFHSGDRYLAEVEDHLHGWLYPIKSLLSRGVEVGAGSDAPVAPANPLESLCAAVTRLSRDGSIVGEDERISPEEALRLHTLGAARVCGEGDRTGSIEPGKLADLVVLSADPTACEPEEIRGIQVEMTLIGGRVAWQRGRGGG